MGAGRGMSGVRRLMALRRTILRRRAFRGGRVCVWGRVISGWGSGEASGGLLSGRVGGRVDLASGSWTSISGKGAHRAEPASAAATVIFSEETAGGVENKPIA